MRDRYTYVNGIWVDENRDEAVDPEKVMNAQNEKIFRLRNKSRAHRKSLKDQQHALLERNSRIAALEHQLSLVPSYKGDATTSWDDNTSVSSPVSSVFTFKVT